MMKLDIVSFNVGVPGITDDVVLDVLGAGIANLIDEHKSLGLEFSDMTMQEHARLTIGDHLCEHIGERSPYLFSQTYNTVMDQLAVVMAAFTPELEQFATHHVGHIDDITWLTYPGLIRILVRENPFSCQ